MPGISWLFLWGNISAAQPGVNTRSILPDSIRLMGKIRRAQRAQQKGRTQGVRPAMLAQ